MLVSLAVQQLDPGHAQESSSTPFLERLQSGTPHQGKVLAAIQPHSDDVALLCSGTVAKLIQEGYSGYMIRATIERKIDANICNVAKGPGGHHGSKLRAELAKQGQKLPLLGDDDRTADRNYIKEFVLAGNRELGKKYGVEYAEAFHYIGPRRPRVDDYLKRHAVPLK